MSYDPNKLLAGGKFQEDQPNTPAVYVVALATVGFIIVTMIALYVFDRAFIAKRDKEADEKYRIESAKAAAAAQGAEAAKAEAAQREQVQQALQNLK
ncbi:MAG: hypothetical protein RL095_1045 [Verrucomicrobiota bacterium]|jgi:hypothetical protein